MNRFNNYEPCKIVAEIGCNHKGDFDIAKELVELAKDCGASYAKFQKRNNRELLTIEQYDSPHPNPYNSYGKTYGEHREFLEFNLDQHRDLKKYCESLGIGYATSVWESKSAEEIISLSPDYIKVPSACNNNMGLLETLRDSYSGDIHISFGMTTHDEERRIVDLFEESGVSKDRLVIYSCTSGYPVPFNDVCLLEISRLYEQYGGEVKEIGFSGHHLGIAVDIAAYAIGAKWIERHFTKDRTWKGTDHAASLEPTGFGKLVRDISATQEALHFKDLEILNIEEEQRQKLKYKKI